MAFEREGLIKDDTKVADVCAIRNSGAINAEFVAGFVELFEATDDLSLLSLS